ncbi:DUF2789 domain-containing protein [Brachymonas sp. G13]|uniref:DUF2789 domain-containing protein n=1 Tax=Brachymonas TaxID=28219 RepID=UPI002E79B80E|nr:DUF2789 domain-containing protein [Brachymonas sp. J145]MEE1652911.1 DUF2789 domain-containing protein [Brachymonas sp. J145]
MSMYPTSGYTMEDLFSQLGLPSDEQAIRDFVQNNRLDASCVNLCDAPFWNESQARFLKEELERDANWAVVVDDLAARLQGEPPEVCPVSN